jgi:hypothetical protein
MGSVVGVYETDEQARFAFGELGTAGIPEDVVSVIGRGEDEGDASAFAGPDSPTAKGAARGAVVGGAVAAVAMFMIPGGAGVFLASGALGGLMMGAAVGGGLGVLAEVGVPTEAIPDFEEDLTEDRYLVVVHGEDDHLETAWSVLEMTDRESLTRY